MLQACAVLGFAGCASLIVGNVVASMVVPGHDWVADTVSDLAAGRYEIIQDVSLYGFAGALLAMAIGAAHHHLDGKRWSLGIFALAILGLLVAVIGARNEYGDGDDDGIVVHIELVYGLGVLFVAGPLLMRRGMGAQSPAAARAALGVGLFWVVVAPLFFLSPTAYDGAIERALGLAAAVWVAALATLMWRAGRESAG